MTREEQWQQELIPTVQFQRNRNPRLSSLPALFFLSNLRTPHWGQHAPVHAHLIHRQKHRLSLPKGEPFVRRCQDPRHQGKKNRPRRTSLPAVRCESEIRDPGKDHCLSIEQAITSYIAYHHRAGHEAKTLEWHQIALGQFRKYVQVERHLLQVCQITETDLESWFVFLAQTPTKAGKHRAASTIETYARSVRAFCCWLVRRGDLPCSPLGEEEFPSDQRPFSSSLQPETFDRLVQAAAPQSEEDGGSRSSAPVGAL